MASHLLQDPKSAQINAFEAKGANIPTYEIPSSYQENRLQTMAVDPYKIFCYWEVSQTDSQIDDFDDIFLALCDKNGELKKIEISQNIGSHYFEGVFDGYEVFSQIYKNKDGKKNILLSSNKVKVPKNYVSLELSQKEPNEDVWMKKEEGWTEIIRSSLTHFSFAKSSKSIVEELEFLKKWQAQSISSSQNIKDKK